MPFLTAAVVILTLLVAVDLVLSAAIIRRQRQNETRLNELVSGGRSGPAPGSAMPEFSAEDGRVTRAHLVGASSLVGFFSSSCRYCPAQAERLAAEAGALREQGIRVLSILTLDEDGTDELSHLLKEAGEIVVERGLPSELAPAFAVGGTPTFLLYDADGLLVDSGNDLGAVLAD